MCRSFFIYIFFHIWYIITRNCSLNICFTVWFQYAIIVMILLIGKIVVLALWYFMNDKVIYHIILSCGGKSGSSITFFNQKSGLITEPNSAPVAECIVPQSSVDGISGGTCSNLVQESLDEVVQSSSRPYYNQSACICSKAAK